MNELEACLQHVVDAGGGVPLAAGVPLFGGKLLQLAPLLVHLG